MFADEEDDDFGPIVPDNNGGVSADGGVRIAHNASDFKMGEETSTCLYVSCVRVAVKIVWHGRNAL